MSIIVLWLYIQWQAWTRMCSSRQLKLFFNATRDSNLWCCFMKQIQVLLIPINSHFVKLQHFSPVSIQLFWDMNQFQLSGTARRSVDWFAGAVMTNAIKKWAQCFMQSRCDLSLNICNLTCDLWCAETYDDLCWIFLRASFHTSLIRTCKLLDRESICYL